MPESVPPTPESGTHAAQVPFHCPHPLHETVAQLGHVEVGVHTGGEGHEQAPQAQVTEHAWLPYVLQDCTLCGVHVP